MSAPVTTTAVDSIKTGLEGGGKGIWGPGVQAYPSLHSGLGLGKLTFSSEGDESSFYKAGSEALRQAPFVNFLCPPPTPMPTAFSIILFQWLALTDWKFATQMLSLSLSMEPRCPSPFWCLLKPAFLWVLFFPPLQPLAPRCRQDR